MNKIYYQMNIQREQNFRCCVRTTNVYRIFKEILKELELFKDLISANTFQSEFNIYFISETIAVKGVLPVLVVLCVTAGEYDACPAFISTVAVSLPFTSTCIFILVTA